MLTMINIQIKENMAYLEVEENGRSFKKLVTLDNFRKSIGITEHTYDSGFLPGRWGIKRLYENSRVEKAIYIEPARRRQIKFRYSWVPEFDDNHTYTEEAYREVGYEKGDKTDEEYEQYLRDNWSDVRRSLRDRFGRPVRAFDIMVPNAVLFMDKNIEYNRTKVKVFTTGGTTVMTGNERLYEYPMPNIYEEDGSICWGDLESGAQIESLRNIEGLFPSFLASEFNHDLYDNRLEGELLDVWKEMHEMFKEGKSEEEVLSVYNGTFIELGQTINNIWNQ